MNYTAKKLQLYNIDSLPNVDRMFTHIWASQRNAVIRSTLLLWSSTGHRRHPTSSSMSISSVRCSVRGNKNSRRREKLLPPPQHTADSSISISLRRAAFPNHLIPLHSDCDAMRSGRMPIHYEELNGRARLATPPVHFKASACGRAYRLRCTSQPYIVCVCVGPYFNRSTIQLVYTRREERNMELNRTG